MTRDEIISMAREAGLHLPYWNDEQNPKVDTPNGWSFVSPIGPPLERFAVLVAAKEREACAKVCEQTDEDGEGPDCWGWHAKDYARAIRARGMKHEP